MSNTVQKNKVESDDICDLVNCTKQDFLTLVSFLKHENRLEVWHYMQLKIDECASILLSNYWEYVEASSELTGKLHHVLQPCHILSQKVVVKLENSNEYLSSDILLEGNSNAEQVSDKLEILNKAIEEQKETKIIYDTLVKVITYYSGLLARQVKSVMCLVPDHPYENMNHAILPISNGKLESLRTNFKVISSYKNEKHTQKIVANLTSKIKEHHRRDISLLNIIVNDKDYPDAIYKHAKLHA